MFPGVSRPFGAVKVGPDVEAEKDSYAGYQHVGTVTGFSLMHVSG